MDGLTHKVEEQVADLAATLLTSASRVQCHAEQLTDSQAWYSQDDGAQPGHCAESLPRTKSFDDQIVKAVDVLCVFHGVECTREGKVAHKVKREETKPIGDIERLPNPELQFAHKLTSTCVKHGIIRLDSDRRERTLPYAAPFAVFSGIDDAEQAARGLIRLSHRIAYQEVEKLHGSEMGYKTHGRAWATCSWGQAQQE
jgi:hypothetical protein